MESGQSVRATMHERHKIPLALAANAKISHQFIKHQLSLTLPVYVFSMKTYWHIFVARRICPEVKCHNSLNKPLV